MKQNTQQKSLYPALIRCLAEQRGSDGLKNSHRLCAQYQTVKDQGKQPIQYADDQTAIKDRIKGARAFEARCVIKGMFESVSTHNFLFRLNDTKV
jgi:hypothetical protein